LIFDLRKSRGVRPEVKAKVLSYIASGDTWQSLPKSKLWDDAKDAALWDAVAQGKPRKAIAAELGLSLVTVYNRINRLADERLPFRPHGMRLADAIRLDAQGGGF